jgi:hypothetical protein
MQEAASETRPDYLWPWCTLPSVAQKMVKKSSSTHWTESVSQECESPASEGR